MKKIIFLLLFSISFLKAEPITAINGYCVDNYYYNGSTVYYLVSNNHFGTNYQATSFSSNVYYQILLNEGKYTLNENGACVLKTVSTTNYYGMTKEQFTFLMSLTGSLCGFTFLFFACFLAIGFERRRK